MFLKKEYMIISRKIPFPENITPSKIDATVENGILKIEVPKQNLHLSKKLK